MRNFTKLELLKGAVDTISINPLLKKSHVKLTMILLNLYLNNKEDILKRRHFVNFIPSLFCINEKVAFKPNLYQNISFPK